MLIEESDLCGYAAVRQVSVSDSARSCSQFLQTDNIEKNHYEFSVAKVVLKRFVNLINVIFMISLTDQEREYLLPSVAAMTNVSQ